MSEKSKISLTIGAALLLLFFLFLWRPLQSDGPEEAADKPSVPSAGVVISTVWLPDVSLIKMEPRNAVLEFVDSLPPDRNDQSVLMVVPGAFTGQRLEHFKPFNVCGKYVTRGRQRSGFPSKYCTGYCLAYGDTLVISDKSSLKGAIREAVEKQGNLFQQFLLVKDSRIAAYIPFKKATLYRALCIAGDGKLLIYQSTSLMTCADFADALVKEGIKEALYLDMGMWSWGWARDTLGNISDLSLPFDETRYQTNWVVLRKKSEP